MILTWEDDEFEDAARANGLWVRTGGRNEDGSFYEDLERVLPTDDRFEAILNAGMVIHVAVVLVGKTYQRWQERLGE